MENETYKIIKIIDDYRVVINAGRRNGIKPGMEFEIFIRGIELTDDTTGESFGTLDYVKGVVEVVDVMEGVSICENVETYTKTTSPFIAAIENMQALAPQTKTYIKPLEVDQSQITGYGFNIDKVVRLGDLVRERD